MPPSVVTLGKFDGMHTGHQKLIEKVREIAKERKLQAVMFTFDISPQIKIGKSDYKLIVTRKEKLMLAEKFGIDVLVECPFNEQIRNMSAEDFIKDILIGKINTKAVVAGTDFKFGKNRQGDADYLKKNAAMFGFSVDILEKEKDGGRDISSTYVREELAKGNIEKANKLLGFEYFLIGEVIGGTHIGRNLGFPTINMAPQPDKLLPPNGVYASLTEIDRKMYKSISNIGVKPTVNGKELGAETFIFDFDGNLYGKTAVVKLLDFMRPEKKFDSVEDLKKQVYTDIQNRKEL
ncbi:MAG TPA: bifunctional riboflavin kinase/FAD synthetase [Candidatus Alectryocaccobium stercorigallinarum]|nr:bifunctional riboflavin kinase/FAD synthetase [Candidatus Alectryocaccobium stercorigallinarum]